MKNPFALQNNRMLAFFITTLFAQVAVQGQAVYNSVSQTVYSNVALGKPAAASSADDAAHAAMYAFDGNQDTRFASGYTDDQWLSVDMGKAYLLNNVLLVWEKSYGKDFNILFSNDGSFTDLYIDSIQVRNHVLSNNSIAGRDTIQLKSNTIARYARIQGVHRATTKGYSIWEMQVMGTASTANLSPVSVTDFAVAVVANSNVLEWTCITEYNNAGYSIERSSDAINFSSIGWANARNGGTVPSHYLFADKQPLPGKSYYRLKQTWLDGKTAYSTVITVTILGNSSVNTYPVPVKDRLVIEYKGTSGESISIDLFNAFGLPVYNSRQVVQSAQQLIVITRTSNMPAGEYFLTISAGNTKKYSGKIVLQ